MSPPKSNKCRRRRHRSIALRLFCHVSKQRRQCSLSQSVARSRSRFHEGGNDCEQKTNDGYVVRSKEGTQPTTFGIQISFLLLVTKLRNGTPKRQFRNCVSRRIMFRNFEHVQNIECHLQTAKLGSAFSGCWTPSSPCQYRIMQIPFLWSKIG